MTASLVNNSLDVKEKLSSGLMALRVHPYQEPGDSLNVNFTEPGFYFEKYAEASAVAGLATVDVVSYTVPVGKELKLLRIDYSGENKSIMSVKINTITKAKKRTWFANFNGEFLFEKYILNAGDILTLTVQNESNSIADFNGNIQGILDDA